VDPFSEVCVLADEDVVRDARPHVQPAVLFGLDVAAETDPLAGDDVPPAYAELDGTLAARDDVPLRHEVVFLDGCPVREDEFVEGI